MSKADSIKELILLQVETIARNLKYDFLYDDEDGKLLCQIIKRDFEGSIIGTPLSFHLFVNEEKGSGEVIYYNQQGEFKKQKFNVFEQDTFIEVLTFIQERLSVNSYH